MLEEKTTYSIEELFDLLPMTISQLARNADINEVTLARVRDGKTTRRDTVNKLLLAFSDIYKRNLTIYNVTGIVQQRNKRRDKVKKGL